MGLAVSLVYLSGIFTAILAILYSRTPQGAIAWSVALVLLPFVSLPLFVVFGRNKLHRMVSARRAHDDQLAEVHHHLKMVEDHHSVDLANWFGNARVLTELTQLPFIRGNQTELLIDGEATFEAIFAAINEAETYVLAEFYIVCDDQLGREFQAHLIAAAKRGCSVYLLYDDVGSRRITKAYIHELQESGVFVSNAQSSLGWTKRFQLNFRNHRKAIIVDGKTALLGGLNVGDEYVHRSERLTPWRDTFIKLQGPAVLAVQLAFVEDWLWDTGEVPKLCWTPKTVKGYDQTVFVLPSGPDDEYETCGLFFTHLINCAQQRLWIASPYFVPDDRIVTALQLAAMRGVDVRILIPGLVDKWFVKLAAMAFVPEVTAAGVKMYEYGKGFLHQKAALMDDEVSLVGTANFDNRSFRLNFEITSVTIDRDFNDQVRQMFEADFAQSQLVDPNAPDRTGILFRVSSRLARLFAPIL